MVTLASRRLGGSDADAETRRREADAELLALPVRVSDRRPPLFLLQLWGTEEVSKQQSWANMCWAADRQQPSAMTGDAGVRDAGTGAGRGGAGEARRLEPSQRGLFSMTEHDWSEFSDACLECGLSRYDAEGVVCIPQYRRQC